LLSDPAFFGNMTHSRQRGVITLSKALAIRKTNLQETNKREHIFLFMLWQAFQFSYKNIQNCHDLTSPTTTCTRFNFDSD